ncbi:hypothetical protein [Streptomyces sp. NRRL F-2580]|uniref:hypothetical protein n=1 Tax=Streptomyces sp. NRRL F-2580 TaxID=1463841 RepID=UPI0004C8787E|nr:hypothetical protein [Streptomyces sp. NRRL F-2580]
MTTITDRDPAQTERLLRFHQPEMLLRQLGPLDEPVLAALFGTDAGEYRGRQERFEERNREAAARLSAGPDAPSRIAALPFRPGEHVVALGESTTADRLSWFEILRHLLPDGVRCTHPAVSPVPCFQRPDWVLRMLGANDVQRIDRTPLVAFAEAC